MRTMISWFLLYAGIMFPLLAGTLLSFVPFYYNDIADDCGLTNTEESEKCWYGKYELMIQILLWVGFCPMTCCLCAFW